MISFNYFFLWLVPQRLAIYFDLIQQKGYIHEKNITYHTGI